MPTRIYVEDKICLQCGAAFNRGVLRGGRPESVADFRVRKFCSQGCYFSHNSGPNHYLYRGELRLNGEGYLRDRNDKFIHRTIMEKYLGRPLEPWEKIHHVDGRRTNNFISNLEITTNSEHSRHHNKSRQRDKNGRFTN